MTKAHDSNKLSEINRILLEEYVKKDREDEHILEKIVKNNIRMVRNMVNKYYESCNLKNSILSKEDMEHEGVIGVITAAKNYDCNKSKSFSTYMYFWIKQKIIRAVQNSSETVRIPAYLKQEMSRASKDESYFEELDEKTKDKIASAKKTKNLDSGEDDKFFMYFQDRFTEDCIIEGISINDITEEMKKILTEREYFIMNERFLKGRTLKSISLELKITRERVRQIEVKAKEKIKNSEKIMNLR